MARWWHLAIVVALAGTAAPAHAQPGPAPGVDRREQIKKKIRAIRAYTLTEELGLDEATAGKLFPLLARYDDELDKLVAQRVEAHKRLNAASKGPDPRAADRAIEDVLANQRAMRAAEERRVADFRKILTPQQAAKILVVLPAIDRKIQQQLTRAIRQATRGNRPNGPRGGRPNAPAPAPIDDDDGDDGDDDDLPALPPGGAPQVGPPAPAPRPAPVRTGKLQVNAKPAAHVTVDGADVGVTPLEITVPAGPHKLTFVVGSDRFTYPIEVKAGETLAIHKDLR